MDSRRKRITSCRLPGRTAIFPLCFPGRSPTNHRVFPSPWVIGKLGHIIRSLPRCPVSFLGCWFRVFVLLIPIRKKLFVPDSSITFWEYAKLCVPRGGVFRPPLLSSGVDYRRTKIGDETKLLTKIHPSYVKETKCRKKN